VQVASSAFVHEYASSAGRSEQDAASSDPVEGDMANSVANVPPVEQALALALAEAARAGRFDVVSQLAKELDAADWQTLPMW
jgi:hypothetical protein